MAERRWTLETVDEHHSGGRLVRFVAMCSDVT